MFSVSAAVLDIRGVFPASAGVQLASALGGAEREVRVLSLGNRHAGLNALLPDGGFPRGAIVELAAVSALGRTTTVALEACAAVQAEARLRSGDPRTVGAWCAFLDPWSTLHAPAVVRLGVDPRRLLVVRPSLGVPASLARVAVRVAQSRAFGLVIADLAAVPGVMNARRIPLDGWVNVIRRLALAIEGTDTCFMLLTDASAPRALPLPVALRVELAVTGPSREWQARIAKDRYGRVRGWASLSPSPTTGSDAKETALQSVCS
jgi:hypothetical protein